MEKGFSPEKIVLNLFIYLLDLKFFRLIFFWKCEFDGEVSNVFYSSGNKKVLILKKKKSILE